MIRNEQALEVTRQRIQAFQDALIALRRHQSPSNYTQIAKNFLYEIRKMEAELHEYLQRALVDEDMYQVECGSVGVERAIARSSEGRIRDTAVGCSARYTVKSFCNDTIR